MDNQVMGALFYLDACTETFYCFIGWPIICSRHITTTPQPLCRWNGFKHVLDQQYNQFYETVFGRCSVNPLSPHDALKHHFTSLKTDLIFLQLRSFRKKSMKLFCQYMAIFFNFSLISSHLYPIQVENCDSNSRLVVDEDDNNKFRPEKVNPIL